MQDGQQYTIREVSELLKIPVRNLRYFCDNGLIPNVCQSQNGYRSVAGQHGDFIKLLNALQLVDSSLEDLKRLSELYRKHGGIGVECQELLRTKKRQLWQKLTVIQDDISLIERYEEIFDK